MNTFQWWKAVRAAGLMFMLPAILYAASMQKLESSLESARRDLRISVATEARMASELEKLKKSGDISPDTLQDYNNYLIRLRAVVSENRKKIAEMEALRAKYDTQKSTHGSSGSDDTSAMLDPAIPEAEVVDEVTALDRLLDSSLAEFDEMLLRELDLIQAKSSEKLRDLAEAAEAAAQALRDRGIEIDTDSETKAAESPQDSTGEIKENGKENGELRAGKESRPEETGDDGTWTSKGKSEESAEGPQLHPKNRYDPKDDDIVARQLREAAEKEPDPELKEKLWKEYEQYKKNVRK